MNNTLSFHNSAHMTFQKLAEGIYTVIKNRGGDRGGFFTSDDVVSALNTKSSICIVDSKLTLIASNFELKAAEIVMTQSIREGLDEVISEIN